MKKATSLMTTRRIRTLAGAVVAGMIGAVALIAATVQPAIAQVTFESAPRLAWTYTDSANKDTAHAVGQSNVPIGTWFDAADTRHKSRSHVTYDLSGYAGKTIVSTKLFLRDDKTTDCDVRALEVWETAVPAAPPTWRTSPEPIMLLGTFGASACPGTAGIDLTDTVRAAAAAGQTRLALELRISDEAEPGEGDPTAARSLSWYYGLRLTVGYNTPPTVVTEHLYNNGRACATQAPYPYLGDPTVGGGSAQLGAMFTDADSNSSSSLTGEFAIWPLTDPGQRTVVTRTSANPGFVNNVTVPVGVLADGVSYGWAARVTDGTDTSEWSQTCYFTFDTVRPATAPGVASPNYPEGTWATAGAAPTFTFTPSGVADVAAYQYSFDVLGVLGYSIGPNNVPLWTDPFDKPGFVRAGPDGSATVTIAFARGGPLRLTVRSYDRAYLSSPSRTYSFYVPYTDPTVTPIGQPVPGQPTTFSFSKHPDVVDVTEYTYRVDDAATQTVAAASDDSAQVSVTLTGYGWHTVYVSSRSSNGFVSSEANWWVNLENTPTVTSEVYPDNAVGGGVGVAGSFTFHPGSFGAASYVYNFDWVEERTVEASADGTATVSFTPDTSGYHTVAVRAIDADGVASEDTYYTFEVAEQPRPIVSSPTYPEWSYGGGVGVAGTFTFQPGPTNTASYGYAFNGGEQLTAPAGADGSATISFTPEYAGFHELYVYPLDSGGAQLSEPTYYFFFVTEPAP